jgi:hypothetical protein
VLRGPWLDSFLFGAKENKEPASPEDLARNLQLFVLLRIGMIAEGSERSNTGKALSAPVILL